MDHRTRMPTRQIRSLPTRERRRLPAARMVGYHPIRRAGLATVVLLATLLFPDAASAQERAVPLYDGLGDHHHPIPTSVAAAQAYFDQGLRLQYAFNHAEAIRSYEEALRHDPSCALCWWGIALASGPNINAAMDPESGRRAYEAIRRALELAEIPAGSGSDLMARARAYIEALAERYGPDPEADRARLDSAYARAMASLAERYPEDTDALTLYAASVMNLSPWNYWEGESWTEPKEPRPGTPEILAALERALEIDRDHPGACHYYIHAVEAAYPERAESCADRLASLMPGAGHIVHMPAHIYIRVGRYADAVATNEHAVHADETYIEDRRPTGLYPATYYPHNYHFMSFAATMAGMSRQAMEAARTVAPKVPPEVAAEAPFIQNALVLPQLTAVNFGRWEEALEAPMPPGELAGATAMAHYARGVAFAATGRPEEGREELLALRRVLRQGGGAEAEDGPETVVAIAAHALAGELELRGGRPAEAVTHFERAMELEDRLPYEEPPLWYYPIRHSLGLALLEAGRPAEAERRYREDLARFPENGWSLYGLAESLRALGRDREAEAATERFRRAWKDADVRLDASRF